MRWLNGITDATDMNLGKLLRDGEGLYWGIERQHLNMLKYV